MELQVPSKPAYQTVTYTEWHTPDVVLTQLTLLMISTWLVETCRELKHIRKNNCTSSWLFTRIIIHHLSWSMCLNPPWLFDVTGNRKGNVYALYQRYHSPNSHVNRATCVYHILLSSIRSANNATSVRIHSEFLTAFASVFWKFRTVEQPRALSTVPSSNYYSFKQLLLQQLLRLLCLKTPYYNESLSHHCERVLDIDGRRVTITWRLNWRTFVSPSLWYSCRLRLKCDGTRAETRFRLSAKRTSPFK